MPIKNVTNDHANVDNLTSYIKYRQQFISSKIESITHTNKMFCSYSKSKTNNVDC